MKKLLTILTMAFLICVASSCQQGEDVADEAKVEQEESKATMDLVQVRQSIAEANVKLGEAVRAGDASALAGLYTEDTRLLDPKAGMIQGREGVEAYWAGALQMGIKEVVLTTVEVMGMDDMVCEFGKADLTIQPEGMDEIKDQGMYLVIWKKAVDGTWKMYVDIMF
jgi:uncharacterized protein (TIGR02246 family)